MNIERNRIIQKMKMVSRPLSLKEMMRHLGLRAEEKRALLKLLKEMESEGVIIKIRAGRYGLASKMDLVIGRLSCHLDGYGFLIPEKEGEVDVFINQRNLKDAMHNDRVAVRIDHIKKGEKREGSVIRILERANKRIVGRIERQGRSCYIIPEDHRILQHIYIQGAVKAKVGDMAMVEITGYPEKGRIMRGRLIEVLGDPHDPDVEVKMTVCKFDLPHVFPDDCLREAERSPRDVKKEEIAARKDLRRLSFVTIDGETAMDFDDAVCVKREGSGYRLWVAIADVSYYVREGSALDREAYIRGTSVYFPGTAIPMLPLELSNGICSLNPGVERMALTAEMEFDKGGNLKGYEFYESVIKSRERLTYSEVRDILDGKQPEGRYEGIAEDLKAMKELAMILMKDRFKVGSIDFDLPEAEIILDITGRTENVIRSERNIAHRIIEEFMLAANTTVAQHVSMLKLPFLYRVHEEPDQEKVKEFKEFVSNFGYTLKGGSSHNPKDFQRLLMKLEGRPEENMINQIMLRSMKQAVYSEENLGHFGLAFRDYTHFTSPIRRYPDLVVHRILKEIMVSEGMSEKSVSAIKGSLPAVAKHTSQRERVAVEAERDIVDLKKVQFMADKLGEVFRGFITGVVPFGLFVELEEYLIEGLVHVSTLQDDYYHYIEKEHSLLGERRKKRYRIGDMVSVKVVKVDTDRRRVDFEVFS